MEGMLGRDPRGREPRPAALPSPAVTFLLVVASIWTALTVVPWALVRLVLWLAKGRRPKVWRGLGILLVVVLFHLFVTGPLTLSWFGSRMIHTRGDESAYQGPRIAADGGWIPQSRDSLALEVKGSRVDPDLVREARDRAVHFASADGTRLRAFVVPPAGGVQPRATALLVHGLFRGALELEPVGQMFRSFDCEVVLLELRNHGGSGKSPATFGLRESEDVSAAIDFLRGRDEASARRPLVLFGVSMGCAAVCLAAPHVDRLGGLVLDAPMDDARATAERMLGGAFQGRRRLYFPEPFRSLVLYGLEFWSGFSLADVSPSTALLDLDPTVPVLVIGGGEDQRMPPDVVRSMFNSLPTQPELAELWIRPRSDHGRVFEDDPLGYRERIGRLLRKVRGF